jgi:hypothetical protein
MAHKPVGNTKSISTSNTSARSDVISKQSNSLRVVAVGADCHVAIGTNPTATASNYYVASGTSEVISLGNVKSQRVVGVTTGSTTTIDFPEGTGSPFEVGDSVELTGISPTGINTSYAIVSSVDSSSGYSGYFDTRIVIDWDTSGQGAVTAGTGELREVFKVAGKTSTGTGTLYVQQVQVSGVA